MAADRGIDARAGDGRQLLIYDGDCAFCSSSARLLMRVVSPDAQMVPWQRADLAALGVTSGRASREVLWADSAGRVDGGARAVARALSAGRGIWPAVGAVLRLPPVSYLADAVYRVIARNRYRLPGGTPACAIPPGEGRAP